VLALKIRFLADRAESFVETMRSAGIAVVPRVRGYGIGKAMRARQIDVAPENGMAGLFSETTNEYAAGTITPFFPSLWPNFLTRIWRGN
jgi:N-acetylglutamate synthase-like GNAT family acetyltransferase